MGDSHVLVTGKGLTKELIGMNASKDKTYELKPPAGPASAPDLVSGKTVALGAPVKVPPQSTVVLYVGR